MCLCSDLWAHFPRYKPCFPHTAFGSHLAEVVLSVGALMQLDGANVAEVISTLEYSCCFYFPWLSPLFQFFFFPVTARISATLGRFLIHLTSFLFVIKWFQMLLLLLWLILHIGYNSFLEIKYVQLPIDFKWNWNVSDVERIKLWFWEVPSWPP